MVGWGGTFGPITAAVEDARADGLPVSQIHIRHLNPFPSNLGEVLKRFKRVLCPELNDGQLALLLRARYLVDIRSFSKISGQPFKVAEIRERIEAALKEDV